MSANSSTTPQDAVCQDCSLAVTGAALKCDVRSGCGRFTHLGCSGLPAHYLVRFEVSRASYLCKTCVKSEAGQQYEECLVKIQRLLKPTDSGDNGVRAADVIPRESGDSSQDIEASGSSASKN